MVIWRGKAWKSAAPGGGRGTAGVTPQPPTPPPVDGIDFQTGVEIDTGDTWDGAKIYSKVVSFGALPNNTTKSVAHGILNLEQPLNMYAAAYDGTSQLQPLFYNNNTNTGSYIRLNADIDDINIVTNFDATALIDVYVFIFYTKVEMVDIVTGTEFDTGDTLDASTIYGKIINLGALPNNGTINVAHGITTLADILELELIADNGTLQYSVTWASSSSFMFINADQTNINVQNNTNFSAFTGRAFITYTKV